MAHDESLDAVVLASETPDYTPADIKYLLNETRRALRDKGEVIRALADDVQAFFDQYGLHTPPVSLIRDGEEVSLLPPPTMEA